MNALAPTDAGCPWHGFTPATIRFCEEPLCAWISQPANTWSNLAYIAVGLFILWHVKRFSPGMRLSLFGIIAIAVGFGSFFFHASTTFVGEFFDLGSMYLFSSLLLVGNLARLQDKDNFSLQHSFDKNWRKPIYVGIVLASLAVLLIVPPIGIALFTLHVLTILALEIYMATRGFHKTIGFQYRPILISTGLFVLAFAVWVLDITRLVCSPDNNWLQGHAAWHIITSVCFYFSYRFYAQFAATGAPSKSAL